MSSETLEEFIKSLKEGAVKIGGKHPPISETREDQRRRLKVKRIYNLNHFLKGLYLIKVRNYTKPPKYRYFIALSLAGQSSDLLVYIAKDFALQHEVKLIQYSLYPKHKRVNLLGLKELIEAEEFEEIVNTLKKYRDVLKTRLEKVKDLVINDQKL